VDVIGRTEADLAVGKWQPLRPLSVVI